MTAPATARWWREMHQGRYARRRGFKFRKWEDLTLVGLAPKLGQSMAMEGYQLHRAAKRCPKRRDMRAEVQWRAWVRRWSAVNSRKD